MPGNVPDELYGLPLNGVNDGCMPTPRVRPQYVEEIRESRHSNGVEGFDVAHVLPVLSPTASVATSQIGVKLCQGEAVCKNLRIKGQSSRAGPLEGLSYYDIGRIFSSGFRGNRTLVEALNRVVCQLDVFSLQTWHVASVVEDSSLHRLISIPSLLATLVKIPCIQPQRWASTKASILLSCQVSNQSN